jgi:signal transduction histidine kinase
MPAALEKVMDKAPLSRLAYSGILFLALGLAATVGFLDYITGYDVLLSPFYLIPICLAAWLGGQRTGLLLSVVCAIFWLLADLYAGHPYVHNILRYWNAVVLLAFFSTVVYLLCGLQRRTMALRAEIQERQRLEAANLRAERLAMVGTMAAQLAHEVRNPLGSITLNLDLMAKEIEKLGGSTQPQGEEGLALVKEIRAEVRRIQTVIEEYLRFARLRKPQVSPVNLNEFLEHKLAFMGSVFDEASVGLRTAFDSRLGAIDGDAEQLWQAVLNLVRNSLEAMPDGGTLAISTERLGDQAVLRLADTGRGMTDKQVKQIFQPFFTTKPQGTGLGLPLAEQILNEHGARIECASQAGEGTRFTIYFPLPEKA